MRDELLVRREIVDADQTGPAIRHHDGRLARPHVIHVQRRVAVKQDVTTKPGRLLDIVEALPVSGPAHRHEVPAFGRLLFGDSERVHVAKRGDVQAGRRRFRGPIEDAPGQVARAAARLRGRQPGRQWAKLVAQRYLTGWCDGIDLRRQAFGEVIAQHVERAARHRDGPVRHGHDIKRRLRDEGCLARRQVNHLDSAIRREHRQQRPGARALAGRLLGELLSCLLSRRRFDLNGRGRGRLGRSGRCRGLAGRVTGLHCYRRLGCYLRRESVTGCKG